MRERAQRERPLGQRARERGTLASGIGKRARASLDNMLDLDNRLRRAFNLTRGSIIRTRL